MSRLFRREPVGNGRFAEHERSAPEVVFGAPALSHTLTKIHHERGERMLPRSSKRWPSIREAREQPVESVRVQALYAIAGSSWHLVGYDPDTQMGYGYVCRRANAKRAKWEEFSLAELDHHREGQHSFLVYPVTSYPKGKTGADAMEEVRRGDNQLRLDVSEEKRARPYPGILEV